ncbi:MAG: FAD-binding oxidoreductase [Nostoc sp.]|uniref:FAD-binding oxidoreductase n=1 Tax=Nostoc sp. TaxID=1180 RepID=UPI002FF823F3
MKAVELSKSIEGLTGALQGRVCLPGQKNYDELRTPWLRVINQHPALIVEATSVSDIAAAVRFARNHSLPLGVMSTGHGIVAACDNGLLLRLTQMKRIEINSQTNSARLEPGVTSGEMLKLTEAEGWVYAAGQVSNVGVIGYTLGGGMGWLVRKLGAACEAVQSVEVVLADGSVVTASAQENADLFWAVRGGGGNFGIVASLELNLVPIKTIVGGEAWYSLSSARDVMRYYRDWSADLPEDTSTVLRLMAVEPNADLPDQLRGKTACAIGICHANPETADAMLKPLFSHHPPLVNNIKARQLSEMAQFDKASHLPGAPTYGHVEFLKSLSNEVIDKLVAVAEHSIPPLMQIEVQQLGGALQHSNAGQCAFAPSAAPYLLHLVTPVTPKTTLEDVAKATQKAFADLGDVYTGEANYNFLRGDEQFRVPKAFGEEKYKRLREIKRRFDSENLFHLNLNIAL